MEAEEMTNVVAALALTVEGCLVGVALFREYAYPKVKRMFEDKQIAAVTESSALKRTKKIQLNGAGRAGWARVDGRHVEIVETIKRIPGLKYCHHKKPSDGYDRGEEYVIVTDEVGSTIEMYMSLGEDYAGMSLDEFLLRSLFDQVASTNGI